MGRCAKLGAAANTASNKKMRIRCEAGIIFVRYGEAFVTIEINDKAPDFSLLDQDGEKVSLKDFKGKTVVLYFYPKADTPG
jgi:cytochrome oxidase Cu insertion factor (SCO1/SenC/PrrC family)